MNQDLSNKFQTLHEIVHAARETLSQNIWDYLRDGTETETTLKRNRMALDAIAFKPRVLRDMRNIDASKVIFGKTRINRTKKKEYHFNDRWTFL